MEISLIGDQSISHIYKEMPSFNQHLDKIINCTDYPLFNLFIVMYIVIIGVVLLYILFDYFLWKMLEFVDMINGMKEDHTVRIN